MNIVCTICISSFNQNNHAVSTPCGHLFHYVCLTRWLESTTSCPTCRENCRVTEMKRIFMEVSVNETPVELYKKAVLDILERHRGSPRRDTATKESINEEKVIMIAELVKTIDAKDIEMTKKDEKIFTLKHLISQLISYMAYQKSI